MARARRACVLHCVQSIVHAARMHVACFSVNVHRRRPCFAMVGSNTRWCFIWFQNNYRLPRRSHTFFLKRLAKHLAFHSIMRPDLWGLVLKAANLAGINHDEIITVRRPTTRRPQLTTATTTIATTTTTITSTTNHNHNRSHTTDQTALALRAMQFVPTNQGLSRGFPGDMLNSIRQRYERPAGAICTE